MFKVLFLFFSFCFALQTASSSNITYLAFVAFPLVTSVPVAHSSIALFFQFFVDFGFMFESSPGGNMGFEPDMKLTYDWVVLMGSEVDSYTFR